MRLAIYLSSIQNYAAIKLPLLHESFGDREEAATDATAHGETLLEKFWCEQRAALLHVVVEDLLQSVRRGLVEDESVHLIVKAERTRVEVRGADCAEEAVYHHDFAVMEAVLEVIDLGAALHQFAHLEADDVVVRLAVALCGNHELHADASFQSPAQRSPHLSEEHRIGVDNLHEAFGIVDADAVGLPHDARRFFRPA